MATSTTNFGLTKPAYNEAADVAVINGNMDTVDTVMGVNRNLAKGAQAGLAIVADGDTHAAITAGQYVYVRNNTHSLAEGLYVASANVSANGNITGSNMTAVSGGGLNALNSKIGTYGNTENIVTEVTADGSVTKDLSAYRYVIVAYYSGLHYRQTAIYPGIVFRGSTKCGFDNLDASSRCYFLKQSYNTTTHELTYACVIPDSGNWANGRFDIWGVK